MEPKHFHEQDLQAFLDAPSDNEESSSLPPSIVGDLVVSRIKLGAVYAVGSIAGYCLTLVICAQRSIGLSPLAWNTARLFHHVPDPWCALICGTVFGIAPYLASLILLTRFQHRYLLFRMTWVPVLIPILGIIAMTVAGAHHDWKWYGYWIFAAIITPYGLEILTGAVLRQLRWRPIVGSKL